MSYDGIPKVFSARDIFISRAISVYGGLRDTYLGHFTSAHLDVWATDQGFGGNENIGRCFRSRSHPRRTHLIEDKSSRRAKRGRAGAA